jgi:ferredoxin
MCAQQAPGAFAFDADGLSVFLPGGEWTQDELVDAADSCPTMAISLRLGSGSGGQDA